MKCIAQTFETGTALTCTAELARLLQTIELDAVAHHAEAMRFASKELRSKKEFVLDAVQQNSNALKYAADSFKGRFLK